MRVKVIPVLEDNYMYLVIEENTREALAVDVAVPKRLLEIVVREGASLTTVLTTHHHWDHARGNAELVRLNPRLAVLGADERICALTRRLAHGEELRFGAIHVRCLLTPGHTTGHMSYFLWEDECPDPPAVFSGDALTVAGCGRRLESSAQQMYQSLAKTLGTLPPETVSGPSLPTQPTCTLCTCPVPGSRVKAHQPWRLGGRVWGCDRCWVAGVSTTPSLPVAQSAPPVHPFSRRCSVATSTRWPTLSLHRKWSPVCDKSLWSFQKRDEDDVPTVPSTLGEELLYNPFLRVAEEPVRKFTGKVDPAEVLEVLCREQTSFERVAEPLQPQARALLALQWGLLSTPQQK